MARTTIKSPQIETQQAWVTPSLSNGWIAYGSGFDGTVTQDGGNNTYFSLSNVVFKAEAYRSAYGS